MRWQHKVSLTELIWAYAIYEMQRDEGDSLQDAWVFLGAGYATLGIWIPEGRTILRMSAMAYATPYVAPAALAVAVPLAVGTGVSYAIGGEEGLRDYHEFLTEPSKWIERTQESVETIYDEVIAPQARDVAAGFEWLVTGASNWVERQIDKAKGIPGLHLNPFG